MKKQNIIIISIVVIIAIVVTVLILGGKSNNQNNNINLQNQNIEKTTIASLSVDNWVSVVAEKSNGSYTASIITVCEDKDSCQKSGPNQGGTKNTPTETPPTRTSSTGDNSAPPTDKTESMENKSMLSGTITEVNVDSIILTLDTGETAIVLISDSTRINKR